MSLAQQIHDSGFVIIRELIPVAELESVRASFEGLVDKQRKLWRGLAGPDDPSDGLWATGAQPRLGTFDGLVDDTDSARTIETILDKPLQISQQIMQAPAVAPTQFMMMCSPQTDHGPAAWHRDIHPIDQAPIAALQQDLLANGPGYLQWNLALYDDRVLWVVPGSHARPNTDAENSALADDPRQPLPGGLQVELNAGDAVVYSNLILHWGSSYSPTLRRTVHFGFRSVGGEQFPYVLGQHRRGEPAPFLSPSAQQAWAGHGKLYRQECDLIEKTLRAAINQDKPAFTEGIAALHPGEKMRIVTVILLSKLSYKLHFDEHPERSGYGADFTQDAQLRPLFSRRDTEKLWQRFAWLDDQLKAPDGEQYIPGYQSGPMSYRFESLPEGLTIETVMDSWA
ncbi:MAG: hypothetical protein HOC05_06495 [Gemmatimonadetes bacterium]|nr:hypothetical protein [Gemmatimonadota bacterium]